MPDPLPAPPATFPLRLPGVAWWACFLCVFKRRRSRFFCLALIRLAGARRRPCTVRNGRWALPLKRLPSTPLLTGLPPRFFRHWRRSAPPPPAWGGCPRTPQKNQRLFLFPPFAPSPLATRAHPGPAPPPVVLPAAVRAIFLYRRRCFLRFLPSAPLASSANEKNGPQGRFLPFFPRRLPFVPPAPPSRNHPKKKKPPNPEAFPCEKNCTCNSFSERMLKP